MTFEVTICEAKWQCKLLLWGCRLEIRVRDRLVICYEFVMPWGYKLLGYGYTMAPESLWST